MAQGPREKGPLARGLESPTPLAFQGPFSFFPGLFLPDPFIFVGSLLLYILLLHSSFSGALWATMAPIGLSRGYIYLQGVRVLAVSIYCGGNSFSWGCFSTIFLWLACRAWNPFCDFHGDCLGRRSTFLSCDFGLPRTGSSSTVHSGSMDSLHLSSDISSFSVWTLDLEWNGPRLVEPSGRTITSGCIVGFSSW